MAYNYQLSAVCTELAESTNLAEVHHNHYGNYKKLRSAIKNTERLKFPEAMKFQKVRFRGRVPMNFQKVH